MTLFREILFLPAAVTAAVAIILAIVVLMPPPTKSPAQPDTEDRVAYLDGVAPPGEIDAAVVLQNLRESSTAASASPASRPSERVPVPKAATPREYEEPSARANMAAQARASSTSPGASPDQPRGPGPGEAPVVPGGRGSLGETYVIKRGDTPATIAQQHLGDASRWTEIARANPGLEARSLQIGQILRLPGAAAPAAAEDQVATTANKPAAAPGVVRASGAPLAIHRVAQGDSLYKLARRYYGDASRWNLIQDANPAMLGGGLSELRLDSELIIPALPEPGREGRAAVR
jgi:nucleoid-associated protein YgaU